MSLLQSQMCIGFTGSHCPDTVELSVIGVEERIDGEDTQYSEAQRI